jgi:transposase
MIRGKNDKVDAQPVRRCGIALYAYKNRDEVRVWTPKREVIQKLDRLTATRSRLVKVRKIRTADAASIPFDRFRRVHL